jgi:uncharacterized membrane protein YGL010W
MRSQQAFLDEYRRTHRNPTNVAIHAICVPVIFFASVGMLWTLPLGRWLGLGGGLAPWVNGATVAALPLLVFYAGLSAGALARMAAVFALCAAATLGLESAGAPVFWLCAGLWIAAWAGQFHGHRVEGAKPAFFDDLMFLLVGPLFVLDEFGLLAPDPRPAKG